MYVMLCFHRDPVSKQVLTRQRVLELIELLNVGEAIPSERRLSTDLGVSRHTLRAALDDLVRDGYLERRHGSVGYGWLALRSRVGKSPAIQ